jgi:hypothetical protein
MEIEVPGDDGPKKFRVYLLDSKNAPTGGCIAEYDTTAKVLDHRLRLDQRHAVSYGGKFVPIGEFKKMIKAGEVT